MKRFTCILLALAMLLTLTAAFADETPTLKVLIGYCGFDPNEDPSAKAIEEITGYHVEYSTLPAENVVTKLSAILASREPYDVIILSYDEFTATSGLGAYMPLNDLLASKGQNIMAGTLESLWINATVDNDIIGIPYLLSTENYYSGLRVRTDLLTAAGVEKMPETTDEFYTAMKAVKDKLGIIPIASNEAFVPEIASAFGLYNTWGVTADGIRNIATTPGVKEYVAYMNKLFNDGILDNEWAQNTSDMINNKYYSSKALMYRVYWWSEPSATTTLLENAPDATYAYLPVLKNENGERGIEIVRGADAVAVIPRVAEHPEQAMEFMNSKLVSEEIFRKICIGEEGVDYTYDENGGFLPIQPAFADDRSNASVYLTGTITEAYGRYWSQTRVRKNDILYAEWVKIQDNIGDTPVHYDVTTFMPSNAEFNTLAPVVTNYVNDTMLQMIVGTRSIDEWDDFVKEYYEMGGTQLEEILNNWWNANSEVIAPFIVR